MSAYRFEQAEQCLKSAKILIDAQDYKGSANRSYYAIFHAMRAVLTLKNIDFGKHSAVISYFRKEYIKSGIFVVELSDIIEKLFTIRNKCDYDDFYVISKEDVSSQLNSAEYFLEEIRKSLDIKST
jgi:uncharacterized protein (UPF0332 family)